MLMFYVWKLRYVKFRNFLILFHDYLHTMMCNYYKRSVTWIWITYFFILMNCSEHWARLLSYPAHNRKICSFHHHLHLLTLLATAWLLLLHSHHHFPDSIAHTFRINALQLLATLLCLLLLVGVASGHHIQENFFGFLHH